MTGMMNERLNNLKPEGYIFYEADLFERRSLTNHHQVMSLVPLREKPCVIIIRGNWFDSEVELNSTSES